MQRRTRYPLESRESDFLHSALTVSARTLAHSQAVLERILLASGALWSAAVTRQLLRVVNCS